MTGENERELILASASPRRKDLLTEAGFRFRVVAPVIDEKPLPEEGPADRTLRLARRKAETVAGSAPSGRCVLAADTLVVLGNEVLGKPRDPGEAISMLLRLAGRDHRVLTGFAILDAGVDGPNDFGVEESRVVMRPLDESEIRAYVATRESLDKAGAYALQGRGAGLVQEVRGSRSNVIGLPLERVVPLLGRRGVQPFGRRGA